MKSSLHSLIPFLPFLFNYSACSGDSPNSNSNCLRSSLYILGAVPTENTTFFTAACWFTAEEMCLLHRCIATSAELTTENTALLLLCAFASAGMCLPSRCVAINYSGFQASCHIINDWGSMAFLNTSFANSTRPTDSSGTQTEDVLATDVIQTWPLWSKNNDAEFLEERDTRNITAFVRTGSMRDPMHTHTHTGHIWLQMLL
jgi:hypothetical protein